MLKINPVIATPSELTRMRQALWMLVELALDNQNSTETEPCHKFEGDLCHENQSI